MRHILKDVIQDQKSFLANRKTIERYIPSSMLNSEEIIVISGVRRCGKSVLLQQIRREMPQSDYFFNFDDDRLARFAQSDFQTLYEVFIELYGEQDYFFFDEIQNVDGWEHFVKRLYNSGKKVFVTGSNAKMLSKELGTLLTGCHLSYELFPFSFGEFLKIKGETIHESEINGTVAHGIIQARFNDYLQTGGFPMYIKSLEPLFLKTLYDNILYRDILVRNSISNDKELKELFLYLVSNIGKPCSYTSLAKVVGFKNPTTIKNYIEFIENTYLLQSITQYSDSIKVQIRNPKKIYCIDNALVMKLGFHFSEETGRLLENLVFVELRRRSKEIYYYSDEKSECDFVLKEGTSIAEAIQVSYSMENPQVKEREINGVLAAMRRFNLSDGYILTAYQSEELRIENYNIHVIPTWRWLLDK